MKRSVVGLALLPFLLHGTPAPAEETLKALSVKPGLWETTLKLEMKGRPPGMDEALAKMSPEERAKAEASLPKEPQTIVSKACITKEELEKPLGFSGEESGCTRTVSKATTTEQEFKVVCGEGEAKQVSDARVLVVDPQNVKMSATVTSSNAGKRMEVSTTADSKWIGEDCKGVE